MTDAGANEGDLSKEPISGDMKFTCPSTNTGRDKRVNSVLPRNTSSCQFFTHAIKQDLVVKHIVYKTSSDVIQEYPELKEHSTLAAP